MAQGRVFFPDAAVWPQLSIFSQFLAFQRTRTSGGSDTSPARQRSPAPARPWSRGRAAAPCSVRLPYKIRFFSPISERQLRKYWQRGKKKCFLVSVSSAEHCKAVFVRGNSGCCLCLFAVLAVLPGRKTEQQAGGLSADEFPRVGLAGNSRCQVPSHSSSVHHRRPEHLQVRSQQHLFVLSHPALHLYFQQSRCPAVVHGHRARLSRISLFFFPVSKISAGVN